VVTLSPPPLPQVRAQVRSDPFAAYDIDVRDEGALIDTYSALLASAVAAQQQQQQPHAGSAGPAS
jgi:hypothetical protein